MLISSNVFFIINKQTFIFVFQAANPGAIIEDFIRWYSPRDWVEEEDEDKFGQKKGYE